MLSKEIHYPLNLSPPPSGITNYVLIQKTIVETFGERFCGGNGNPQLKAFMVLLLKSFVFFFQFTTRARPVWPGNTDN